MTARIATVSAFVLALAAAATALVARAQDGFPHADHERLFPLCTGCHAGVTEGDPARFYPQPTLCARCHDGSELARVEWTGPTIEPTNVRFDHVAHAREVAADGTRLDCESCHVATDTARMLVDKAVVPACLDCHAHRADAHFVDADCSTCHRPLAETRFTTGRIALLPAPPDHARPDFLTAVHGEEARASVEDCAVCHTRERCTSCHVDAATQEPIEEIPPADGALALPGWSARYPIPASHRQPDFLRTHGTEASAATCGTCHTRDDCATCHIADRPAAIANLAARAAVEAPGVGLVRRAPPSHAAPSFEIAHGTFAATAAASCTTCHVRTDCERCHTGGNGDGALDGGRAASAAFANVWRDTLSAPAPAALAAVERGRLGIRSVDTTAVRAAGLVHPLRATGETRPLQTVRDDAAARVPRPGAAYHPADFMLRHSSNAFGRRLECANCHDTRAFCADCHRALGMRAVGRLGPGFHDAEPLWLLRHGQAARQGLESCTSCHQQSDCLQCHSQLGAFRVNPHGPGFDARRAQERNAAACQLCHIGNPVR